MESTESYPGRPAGLSLKGLEEGRSESNGLQESAEGIVGNRQAKLVRHSGAERRRNRYAEP